MWRNACFRNTWFWKHQLWSSSVSWSAIDSDAFEEFLNLQALAACRTCEVIKNNAVEKTRFWKRQLWSSCVNWNAAKYCKIQYFMNSSWFWKHQLQTSSVSWNYMKCDACPSFFCCCIYAFRCFIHFSSALPRLFRCCFKTFPTLYLCYSWLCKSCCQMKGKGRQTKINGRDMKGNVGKWKQMVRM